MALGRGREGRRAKSGEIGKWDGVVPLSVGHGAKGQSVCPAKLDVQFSSGIPSNVSLKAVASSC